MYATTNVHESSPLRIVLRRNPDAVRARHE